ncbi:MAG: type II toxin-antitoxin system VapC family toxin [Bifidobacteriaceae bacterium]|jgi:predicted nucleic acid-binding protein|nr:type II toxin-antitoxin system VapC family toxin [Bifidobacteriaceae bacterium]
MGKVVRAVADTSILIALVKVSEPSPDLSGLGDICVSALSWSELSIRLHTVSDVAGMSRRLEEFSALRALFTLTLPYDDRCAVAYQRILARVLEQGGAPKARPFDRMIAATALAHEVPLITRDRAGFGQVGNLVDVIER